MNNRAVAMLVAVLVVAGCGSSEQSADKGGSAATIRAPVAPGADAVAAVLQSPGTPIAKLGFVVLDKPVVGAQAGVRMDLAAGAPVTLLVSASGDGLVVEPAAAQVVLTSGTAGATASHPLKITPQRDGLGEITVRLRSGEEGVETIYVIPVLSAKAAAGG